VKGRTLPDIMEGVRILEVAEHVELKLAGVVA
jgi:hypothetical protein